MNPIDRLLGGVVTKATAAAGDAAAAQAAVQYERFKPLIYAVAFMGVTAYIFYFLPRFTLPWRKSIER